MKKIFHLLVLVCALGLMTGQSPARAQEKIKVLSDGPLRTALIQIGEAFRRESGHQVEFTFGTSPVVHKKVAGGEVADVLIIQPNFIEELVKTGKVIAGEHPVIGRVGFGLTMRTDAPTTTITTTGALKLALLSADSIVFNNVASGNYFAEVLERLNIAETVRTKVVRADPADVFEHVINGKGNDIGVGTTTSIIATKGLRLVGPLPPEVQSYIVYAAAPMTSASLRRQAKRLSAF